MDAERTDTAAILYTGGTTGIPKAVMLSHENINAAIHTVVHHEKSTEYDKALCFLPFNQVFRQMHIMNATILSGGCQELMPGFDLDRVLALMKAGRITKFFSVPTIYVRPLTLDGLKETMSDVRYCVDGLKDMIITGGENVYSLEVEEVLYAHPNVQEFAVIGTPEKEWGERVTTVILPKPGQTIDQK
ncbi:MAG: AMP-binding protein [Desulfobacterales bacterium]